MATMEGDTRGVNVGWGTKAAVCAVGLRTSEWDNGCGDISCTSGTIASLTAGIGAGAPESGGTAGNSGDVSRPALAGICVDAREPSGGDSWHGCGEVSCSSETGRTYCVYYAVGGKRLGEGYFERSSCVLSYYDKGDAAPRGYTTRVTVPSRLRPSENSIASGSENAPVLLLDTCSTTYTLCRGRSATVVLDTCSTDTALATCSESAVAAFDTCPTYAALGKFSSCATAALATCPTAAVCLGSCTPGLHAYSSTYESNKVFLAAFSICSSLARTCPPALLGTLGMAGTPSLPRVVCWWPFF